MVSLLGSAVFKKLENFISNAWNVESEEIELNNHDPSTKILGTLPLQFKKLELGQKITMLTEVATEYQDKSEILKMN